jgi:hypothetical protein
MLKNRFILLYNNVMLRHFPYSAFIDLQALDVSFQEQGKNAIESDGIVPLADGLQSMNYCNLLSGDHWPVFEEMLQKIPDNNADCIICIGTILHSRENIDKLVSYMYRIVKNNGWIVTDHSLSEAGNLVKVYVDDNIVLWKKTLATIKKLKSARYGSTVANQWIDVTKTIMAIFDRQENVLVSNDVMLSDPCHGTLKALVLEFDIGDNIIVEEHGTFPFGSLLTH